MKVAYGIVAVIITGCIAYVGGNALGNYLAKKKEGRIIEERQRATAYALAQHGQVAVGDTVPDHIFETLSYDSVALSLCLYELTFLVSIHPDCGACVEEMTMIAEVQTRHGRTGPFVFISSANPRHVADLRDQLQLDNCFLYDHRKEFLSQFGIEVYPMFVTIDNSRCIQDFVIGGLLKSEIEAMFED